MLTARYLTSTKNLVPILNKIVEGTAPERFTVSHLKGLGFKSSNDQGIVPLLKDLGFLSADGTPTQRYLDYRDRSKSKAVMADAVREAYSDLFHINERPGEADRSSVEGKFKSVHNTTDRVAKEQTRTFYALLELADLDSKTTAVGSRPAKQEEAKESEQQPAAIPSRHESLALGGLRYNIEIHLPATKDPEVFNAIFKSLKEHLLDD